MQFFSSHLHRAAGEVGDAAAGPPKEDSGREGAFYNRGKLVDCHWFDHPSTTSLPQNSQSISQVDSKETSAWLSLRVAAGELSDDGAADDVTGVTPAAFLAAGKIDLLSCLGT